MFGVFSRAREVTINSGFKQVSTKHMQAWEGLYTALSNQ